MLSASASVPCLRLGTLAGQVLLFPRQEKQWHLWSVKLGAELSTYWPQDWDHLCVCLLALSVYALDTTNLSTLNFILFLLLFFGRSFSLQ